MSYYTTTIGSTQAGYTQPIGSISGGSAPTKKTETEAALEAAYINSTIKTQPNMTEELMLQLAAKNRKRIKSIDRWLHKASRLYFYRRLQCSYRKY